MNDISLKQKRDAAVYATYKRGLEAGLFNSVRDAAEWVRKQPAPEFYVSAKKASLRIGYIISKTSLMHLNSSVRRMTWELYRRYKDYLHEHPGCPLSREAVLETLVSEPAPEFYLTAEMVRKIIKAENDKVRSTWYKED